MNDLSRSSYFTRNKAFTLIYQVTPSFFPVANQAERLFLAVKFFFFGCAAICQMSKVVFKEKLRRRKEIADSG